VGDAATDPKRKQGVEIDLLTFRLGKILSEQPVTPEGFMVSGAPAQLLRRETGVPPHLSDHVRLVGKP
jgi:hypothetical protein